MNSRVMTNSFAVTLDSSIRNPHLYSWFFFSILPGGIVVYTSLALSGEGYFNYFVVILLASLSFLVFRKPTWFSKTATSKTASTLLVASIGVYLLIFKTRIFMLHPLYLLATFYVVYYEEYLFRGVLLGILLNRGTNIIRGTIMVSILFSLGHYDMRNFHQYFIMSTYYCVLTIASKSIFPAFTLHALNNLLYLANH